MSESMPEDVSMLHRILDKVEDIGPSIDSLRDKVDKLSDDIESLAPRVVKLEAWRDGAGPKVDSAATTKTVEDHETRIRVLEKDGTRLMVFAGIIGAFSSAFVAAAVALVLRHIGGP